MKKIIGMIHLNDNNVTQALKEIELYQKHGLSGALVENYFGSYKSVDETLLQAKKEFDTPLGVNILGNYNQAVALSKSYDISFIQVDAIAGTYQQYDANSFQRKDNTFLYGGVWPKYYQPVEDSNFQRDLHAGMNKADAIVITGAGTGQETPLEKLRFARSILNNYELIVGAGVTKENVSEQLNIADGCIVGSTFKQYGRADQYVEEERVKEFMEEATKFS